VTELEAAAGEMRTMHIGELAEATGLSLRTIRHYDEVGLLPATTRTEGGFRLYTPADLERLLVIRSMKPLGFTLEEMAELLQIVDTLATPGDHSAERRRLADFIVEAEHKRDKLALNLARAEQFIAELSSRAG
jgi:MerR family copper efflux transcriptional regulator